jgi:hypothetical protein
MYEVETTPQYMIHFLNRHKLPELKIMGKLRFSAALVYNKCWCTQSHTSC